MLKKLGLAFYSLPIIMLALFAYNPAYSLLVGATIDTVSAFKGILIHSFFITILAFIIHYERDYRKLVYARLGIAFFSAFFLAGFIVGPALLIIDAIKVLKSEKAKKH